MKRRLNLIATLGLVALVASAVVASVSAAPISTVTAGTSGKWVKYNMSTCKYVPAASKGTKYTAVLNKAAKPYKVAWGTQDTVFPFTILLNKDISKQAAAAGMSLKVWDNKGNDQSVSSTQPIINAQQIVAYHPDINLWMNTLGPLTAKSMNLFNAVKPCIPTIQFYISPGQNAIYFGNSQPQQGSRQPTTLHRSSRSAAGISRTRGSSAPDRSRHSVPTPAALRSGSPSSRPSCASSCPGFPRIR